MGQNRRVQQRVCLCLLGMTLLLLLLLLPSGVFGLSSRRDRKCLVNSTPILHFLSPVPS